MPATRPRPTRRTRRTSTARPVPAGGTFFEGAVQAVPRYPSNVYYNASKQAQQLDEYNWIYTSPAGGGNCTPITGVTTCRETKATWAQYVASENAVMFRHVVDNDPRPHYIHQSNLADYNPALPETDPNQGGIAYPVFGALVTRYETAFDRASAPLIALTHTQIGQTLAQQGAWASTRAGGKVTAWITDGKVHLKNAGATAVQVPLTGTTTGTAYGGDKSGWITLAPDAEQVLTPTAPIEYGPTQPSTGTPPASNPGTSPATPKAPTKTTRATRLTLSKVKMSPRKFALSHRTRPRGTRLDGSRISFKVSTAASVRIVVQRRSTGRHKRWVSAGTLTRSVKAGTGEVRFTGRFGKRMLKPRSLPDRGHRATRRAGADEGQDGRVPGGQGLMAINDAERSRRFARRRTDADVPDDSLAELHAELVLLREENARLKAAEHKGPDIDGLLTRARSLSATRDDDAGVADETDTRPGRGPRDPRVAAGDLPPDRARDDQLRGPAARAAGRPGRRRRAAAAADGQRRAAATGPSRR